MAYLFAIFDNDTARAPVGMESANAFLNQHEGLKTELERRKSEELCKKMIDQSTEQHRSPKLKSRELGSGNGFSFEKSPFCSHSHKHGVHVLFAGEVSKWPGVDVVSENHNAFIHNTDDNEDFKESDYLLQFYLSLLQSAVTDTELLLECLCEIEGRFAFIVFDENKKCVLASRDRHGSEPFYWGVTETGQLLFGTNYEDFSSCEPTAIAFPSGTLYVSQGDTSFENPGDNGWVVLGRKWPGRLFSFVKGCENEWRNVKEIPRVTSSGILNGLVYKMESDRDIMRKREKMNS